MKGIIACAASFLLVLSQSFPAFGLAGAPVDYFPEAEDKAPYETWLLGEGTAYDRHIFLPASSNPNEGAAVFWSIYQSDETGEGGESAGTLSRNSGTKPWIQFAVAVQATGWVGFGISEAGGMLGADMAIFEASDPSYVRDAYVVEERFPQTDDCEHWDLLNSTIEDGWLILEIARDLDTGDPQDHRIINDSSPYSAGARLIAAWGSGAFGYHGTNVARNTVKLFAEDDQSAGRDIESYDVRLAAAADGSFEVRESDFVIPSRETTYRTVCMTYEELLAAAGMAEGQSATLIGASPVITNETEQFVHHFVVYSSMEAIACEYSSVLTAWAPGETGLELPENVGIPIFGEGETKSIAVEIHYNNPSAIPNQMDSSGIRFYFTFEPREHEAAYLQLGDPLLQLSRTQIGEGLSEWSFECAPSCSNLFLGGDSVTVFVESLHMHKSGTRMVNEVIRGGQVVHSGAVDVFEFSQQGSYRVPTEPFEVRPGDGFRTTCYYRDGTEFGSSSQEEMCSECRIFLCSLVIPFLEP
jgi:hypothetical protein